MNLRRLSVIQILLPLLTFGQAGSVDPTFSIGAGPNAEVRTVATRSDNKIIITGLFTAVDGVARNGAAQLNADGSIDLTVVPEAGIDEVKVQTDGKILIRGSFSTYGGVPRPGLARLNANWTLDPTFLPFLPIGFIPTKIWDIQTDGKIILGNQTSVIRLNANGGTDLGFNFNLSNLSSSCWGVSQPNYWPASITIVKLLPSGKIILGCYGYLASKVFRLFENGALDNSFAVTGFPEDCAFGVINDIEVQQDGKILIGGNFEHLFGLYGAQIIRANSNGSYDEAFSHYWSTQNSGVSKIIIEASGKIVLLGGTWAPNCLYEAGGATSIFRLTTNGEMDEDFISGPHWPFPAINDLTIQSSNRLIVAGNQSSYQGIPVNRLTRLYLTGAPVVELDLYVFLGGSYNNISNQMENSLGVQYLIPESDPYVGLGYVHNNILEGLDCPYLFGPTIPYSLIDWIVVELRSILNPEVVLKSTSAFVRNDGKVVRLNGVSNVRFNISHGSYFVAVKHRNHLGVMTANPVSFTGATPSINFTNGATATWGVQAQKNINGTYVLWPGDVNHDGMIKYSGPMNDRDVILTAIGGISPTNSLSAVYLNSDVNMNSELKYTGTNNDRDIILQSIGGIIPTNVRIQQIP